MTLDGPVPDGPLPAGDAEQLAAARLALLCGARRQVDIRLPRLDDSHYAGLGEIEQLRRLATSGRGAHIRVLLNDPASALRDGHRLILLMQRLPSAIQVRVPVEETDLGNPSACLLTDAGGYLFQPDAERPQGRAALADRPAWAPLRQQFDEMWERAERARMLQPLDL
ncbi:hypothetical protein [Frateuria terrea]|uniref:DUF7931 domain-containing protein n=1 Tax=Frateuria terrea TaxID=529704 RepID=A0A1H6TLV8_9GAMM|nr:hypothetical protein [Frateuria terrea]SEI81048.1 hypothetical protein SAMN04487997_1682 [Frateuria terrea]SFP41511.1 hypothetical protein SAMN02927913_2042 [Frateuria terrea]